MGNDLPALSHELKLLISTANSTLQPPEIAWHALDWQRVEHLVEWHQIQAQLYRELCNRPEVPTEFLRSMREGTTMKTVGNMLLTKESVRLLQNLEQEGVKAFLMKGALWASLYYEEIGLREFGDIDFFVDRPDLTNGLKVMEKSGYVPDKYRTYLLRSSRRESMYFATDYQLPLEPKARQPIKSVELQWQVAYPRFALSFTWSELMDRPEEHRISNCLLRVPRAENQLLLMIIHHVGVESLDKLKYGLDLVMLLRSVGSGLDWEYIEAKARQKGLLRMVMMGLHIAQWLDSQLVFPEVVQQLIIDAKSAKFVKSTVRHWELTRPKPVTKSWRIGFHQLRYRDRWTDKMNILGDHFSYATHFNLLYHKIRYYLD